MGYEMWVQPLDPFDQDGPVPEFDGAALAAFAERTPLTQDPVHGGYFNTSGELVGDTVDITPQSVFVGRPGAAAIPILYDALSLGGVLMQPAACFLTRDERWLASPGMNGIGIGVVADYDTFLAVVHEELPPGIHDLRSGPPPERIPAPRRV